MRILCTGADGFVCSALLPKLSNHEVITLDYLNTIAPVNIKPKYIFMNFDLSTGVPPIDEKLDLIIHLATINQNIMAENPMLFPINIKSTQNTLELAKASGAKLLFSSSCSVYGGGLNMNENHPLNPMSLYALGKVFEERLIEFYHDNWGVEATILRFSNCYGDTTNIENKVYPGKKDVTRIFMERALRGQPLPLINGMGRDYTYIGDVVEAILSVMHLSGFNIFNVGTNTETLTDELPALISDALKIIIKTEITPPREVDDIIHRSLNVDKISPYWKPKTALKDGLKKYAAKIR